MESVESIDRKTNKLYPDEILSSDAQKLFSKAD